MLSIPKSTNDTSPTYRLPMCSLGRGNRSPERKEAGVNGMSQEIPIVNMPRTSGIVSSDIDATGRLWSHHE